MRSSVDTLLLLEELLLLLLTATAAEDSVALAVGVAALVDDASILTAEDGAERVSGG